MYADRLYQHLFPDKQTVDELVESPLGWLQSLYCPDSKPARRQRLRLSSGVPSFRVPCPSGERRREDQRRERVGPGLSHWDARHGIYTSTPATYESVILHLTICCAAFHRVFLASRCSPSPLGKEKPTATARQLTDQGSSLRDPLPRAVGRERNGCIVEYHGRQDQIS